MKMFSSKTLPLKAQCVPGISFSITTLCASQTISGCVYSYHVGRNTSPTIGFSNFTYLQNCTYYHRAISSSFFFYRFQRLNFIVTKVFTLDIFNFICRLFMKWTRFVYTVLLWSIICQGLNRVQSKRRREICRCQCSCHCLEKGNPSSS